MSLRLLTDQPLAEARSNRLDGLGFDVYAQVLAAAAAGTPGPFTIGIFGEWGNGKTSLMKLIQQQLQSDTIICVWFNAWQFENEEHPIVPLVGTILQEIERNKTFQQGLKDSGKALLRSLRAIAYGFSAKSSVEIPGFAKLEAGFVMKDIIERDAALTPDPIVDRSLYYRAFESLNTAPLPENARVVVLLDDLDRCFPDNAIKMLEGIKLVLSQPGFIFILGVARSVIEGYLQHRYQSDYGIKSFDGSAYLDKIVQLAFPIPSHASRMAPLVEKLLHDMEPAQRQALSAIVPTVANHLGANPRSLVRFINNLLIDAEISKRAISQTVPIEIFAVTRCLQLRWRNFYDTVVLDQDAALFAANSDRTTHQAEVGNAQSAHAYLSSLVLADPALAKFISSNAAQQWLRQHSMRESAVQFLQVSLRDTELQTLGRSEAVLTIVAGTDHAAVSKLMETMRRLESEYSSEHRTYPASARDDIQAEENTANWDAVQLGLQRWDGATHKALIFVGSAQDASSLFADARRHESTMRTLAVAPAAVLRDVEAESHRILTILFGGKIPSAEG